MKNEDGVKLSKMSADGKIAYLIKPILKVLQDAGGQLERAEIKERIADLDVRECRRRRTLRTVFVFPHLPSRVSRTTHSGVLIMKITDKVKDGIKAIGIVVIAALIATGCASVRLVARETNPQEKEAFVNECGWSMDLEGGKTEIRVGERETLGAVKLHTNYLYALGSVLSFGIWMPFDITYEVNK